MRSLLRFVCLLASPLAVVRADVTVDFNTGSSQLADNFAVGSASNIVYAATGGFARMPFGTVEETSKLQITYIRRKSSSNPGISYAVEFSDAMASWAVNASATESGTSIDTVFERVTVTDSASSTKRFVRVRISAP